MTFKTMKTNKTKNLGKEGENVQFKTTLEHFRG